METSSFWEAADWAAGKVLKVAAVGLAIWLLLSLDSLQAILWRIP